jgi:hypothetical protein
MEERIFRAMFTCRCSGGSLNRSAQKPVRYRRSCLNVLGSDLNGSGIRAVADQTNEGSQDLYALQHIIDAALVEPIASVLPDRPRRVESENDFRDSGATVAFAGRLGKLMDYSNQHEIEEQLKLVNLARFPLTVKPSALDVLSENRGLEDVCM